MKLHTISLPLFLVLLVTGSGREKTAFQQRDATIPARAMADRPSIQANVDYGAQLMLVESHGNRTGYDAGTGKMLHQIPGAAYVDDSISDASDDSDEPATAETRMLHIPPGTYTLKVLPTDRQSYRIQFSCSDSGKASQLTGENISILPGEEHSFSIDSSSGCTGDFAAGVSPATRAPLLSYAFPASNKVHLEEGNRFRIAIVYAKDVVPSSFTATINGQAIVGLFHAKPESIETVSLPVASGHSVLHLSANGGSSRTNNSGDLSFAIDAD